MGEATYFLFENVGIIVASGYSKSGGYTTERNEPGNMSKTTVKASYVPINVGVKLKAKIGIVEPYVYMAPGLYFPKKSSSRLFMSYPADTVETTYSYAMGFGVAAGIGAAVMISNKVGIKKVEVTPSYAFAKQTQYVEKHGNSGLPFTTIYQDNTAQLSPSTADKGYSHDAPRDSFSSIAIKVGMCFKLL